jgi:hypothetical protein
MVLAVTNIPVSCANIISFIISFISTGKLLHNTVEAAYYDHVGSCLCDNNNRLITLSGGYKNLHYLTQFIVTNFTCIKKTTKCILKNLCSVACYFFAFSSSWMNCSYSKCPFQTWVQNALP